MHNGAVRAWAAQAPGIVLSLCVFSFIVDKRSFRSVFALEGWCNVMFLASSLR